MDSTKITYDSTTSEILLCPLCKGRGENLERVSVDDSEYFDCTRCNNTGRVRKITNLKEIPFE